MRPMLLARENPNTSTLQYPVYAFPKLDGIRCIIHHGDALSRTLKEIPSRYVQQVIGKDRYNGLDGELILGDPTSPSVYRDTNSFVMAQDKVEHFTFYVFDLQIENLTFEQRQRLIQKNFVIDNNTVKILKGVLVKNEAELLAYEEEKLNEGYEGIIIRSPDGLYKEGRTTMKENNTYKLKRFVDSEARVVGFEEEMHNGNDAETNELGRTKRSTAKAGLTGKGSLGALVVQDLVTGVEFSIGSGFDGATRQQLWNIRDTGLLGKVVKYKYFPIGIKNKPRHPIFIGFRDMEIDG